MVGKSLSGAEADFGALVQQHPDGLVVVSAEGQVLFANATAGRLLGQSAESLVETHFGFPLEAGQTVEIVLERGRREPTRVELRTSEINWGGRPAFLASLRPIWARPEATAEPVGSETYFRALVESTSDLVAVVDEQGIIQYVSPSITAALGYVPDELIGRDALELIHPDDVPLAVQRLQAPPTDPGRLDRIEVRVRHKQGAWRVQDAATSPIIEAGALRGLVIIARDVTERKQVEAGEQEQHRLAEALRDVAAALNSTLQLEEVLDQILANVGRVVPHDTGSIMLIDGEEVRVVRCRGFAERGLEAHVLSRRVALADSPKLRGMVDTQKPLIIADTHRSPGWIREPETDWIRAYLASPICLRGQVIGFLNLDSTQTDFFTSAQAERLQAFANQAAVAIENARLFEAARQRADELAALYRASAPLLSATDPAQLAEQIVAAVIEEFDQTHCSVRLLDEASSELRSIAFQGRDKGSALLPVRLYGPGLIAAAARSGEMVYAPEVAGDPRYLKGDPRTRSELAIPLRAGGQVIGVLNLESTQPDAFAERARRVLEAFAERAGLALQNARLFATTQANARHLALLNAITRAALESTSFEALLQSLADRLPSVVAADGVTITLWDDVQQRIVAGAASAGLRTLFRTISPEPGELTVTGSVLKTRTTVVEEDAPNSAYVSRRLVEAFAVRAFIGIPLIVGEQILGAALFLFHRPHHFSPDEVLRAEQAANQVALAVANGRLLQRLEQARQLAEEASRLKSDFLANTSHELRTPLSGILGSLKIVLDDLCDSPDEEHAFVRTAYEASRRLLSLIDDLLDVAKIEAGKVAVTLQAVLISTVLMDVFQLTRAEAEQKGLALELRPPPDPEPRVHTDPSKARQILLNLVGNALKFTEQGGITFEARLDAEHRAMEIHVRDTGIGIAVEAQGRLFAPFVQVDASTTRRYGGTGLGLSISRRLAELMGGALSLYSAGEGQGSTFTLTLPLHDE